MLSHIVDRPKLAIIDSNSRRRAAFAQDLLKIASHVEPFENADELAGFCRDNEILLVCDEDQAIESVLETQLRMGASGPVMAYAQQADAFRISDAFHLGVVDYLPWPIEPERLQNRIVAVLRSSEEQLEQERERTQAINRLKSLSPRESQVLDCLSEGGSNKVVAQVLGISVRTVEIHRARLLSKLQATNVVEAVKVKIDAEAGKRGARRRS